LYEEKKKFSASKAKSKKSELKELRFGPSIGRGDLNIKIDRAREFLGNNHRIRVRIRLKGREKAFPEVGFEKIETMIKALEDIAKTEDEPKLISHNILVTLVRK